MYLFKMTSTEWHQFSADHEWIEGDFGAMGFAAESGVDWFGANGVIGGNGRVRDDSDYKTRPPSFWNRRCKPIYLSPCYYDIDGFKNCISSEIGARYSYTAGIRDCAWWVSEVVSLCKQANKR